MYKANYHGQECNLHGYDVKCGFLGLTPKAAARVSASSPQGDAAFACYGGLPRLC